MPTCDRNARPRPRASRPRASAATRPPRATPRACRCADRDFVQRLAVPIDDDGRGPRVEIEQAGRQRAHPKPTHERRDDGKRRSIQAPAATECGQKAAHRQAGSLLMRQWGSGAMRQWPAMGQWANEAVWQLGLLAPAPVAHSPAFPIPSLPTAPLPHCLTAPLTNGHRRRAAPSVHFRRVHLLRPRPRRGERPGRRRANEIGELVLAVAEPRGEELRRGRRTSRRGRSRRAASATPTTRSSDCADESRARSAAVVRNQPSTASTPAGSASVTAT